MASLYSNELKCKLNLDSRYSGGFEVEDSTLNMDVFSLNDPYFFHSFQLKKSNLFFISVSKSNKEIL